MIKIFPNITTADLTEVEEKLKRLQGFSDYVHFDIIDPKFADTKTVSVNQIKDLHLLKKINSFFHLMVVNPIRLVKKLKKIGAWAVVGQIEKMPSQEEFIREVQLNKMKAGLALDDGSRVEDIDRALLSKLDVVLIMTIKAGWVGRSFKKERLEEVKKLKILRVRNGYKYKIAVDGGVSDNTIRDCVKAGAEFLFMHSAIWKSNMELGERLENLKQKALGLRC